MNINDLVKIDFNHIDSEWVPFDYKNSIVKGRIFAINGKSRLNLINIVLPNNRLWWIPAQYVTKIKTKIKLK